VTGRYALSLLMFLGGILLGFALMPVANLFSFSKWYPDFKWCLALIAFGFLLYSLLCLSMYPLLFKLGYLKGRLWGVFVPTMVFGLISALFTIYERLPGNEKLITSMLIYASEHILSVSGGMLVLGGIIFVLSYLLSTWQYQKREF
ncbi:MAG: ABC-2 transporter permease, partial [Lachnospiraceae bacterium]|nr:ABC-2 transporter permease [Lachnospiraceae bacterium]